MTGSVFGDKSRPPADADLSEILGRSKIQWDDLVAWVDAEHPGLRREWKYYGARHGWQLKLLQKKKAALYMVPKDGAFLAAMALRPDGVEAVKNLDLPRALVEEILGGRVYGEGLPVRVTVVDKTDLECVKTLLRFKLWA